MAEEIRSPYCFDFVSDGLAAVAAGDIVVLDRNGGGYRVKPPFAPNCLFAAPTGRVVVVTSTYPSGKIAIIDLQERRVVQLLTAHSLPFIPNVAISADASVLSYVSGSQLLGWDLRTAPPQLLAIPPANGRGTFSADGKSVLTFSGKAAGFRTDLWSVSDGTPQPIGALPGDSWLGEAQTTYCGSRVAFSAFEMHRGAVTVFDLPAARKRLVRQRCEDCRIALSTNCARLLIVDLGESSEVWDLTSGSRVFLVAKRPHDHDEPIAISQSGNLAAWVDRESVRVHGTPDGRLVASNDTMRDVVGLGFSPDESILILAGNAGVSAWELATGRQFWTHSPSSVPPGSIRWSPGGPLQVRPRNSAVVTLLDGRSGAFIGRIQLPIGAAHPDAAELSPDLRRVLIPGRTAWELRTLPPPDVAQPKERLADILSNSGLELQGVELVDMPVSRASAKAQ